MRFCPFCSAESADDAIQCSACTRRLPPMAARRRGTRTDTDAASGSGSARAQVEVEVEAEAPQVDPTAEPGPEPSATQPDGPSTVESPDPSAPQPARSEPDGPGEPVEPAAGEAPAELEAPVSDSASPPATYANADERANDVQAPAPSDAPAAGPDESGSSDDAPPGSSDDALPEPVDLALPSVGPLPAVPERGLFEAARYALAVTRARWQRRNANKQLVAANERDQASLETTLMALGSKARALKLREPVLDEENQAIDRAEAKRVDIERACHEISSRQAAEDSSFADSEVEHLAKVSELERQRDALQREIDDLEARRRGAQDKLDTVERQQRGYHKLAEERDEEAARAAMGDARSGLRRAAEDLRRDAAALEEEKISLERRLAEIERPTSQALARREDILARLDSAGRQLQDARDGHRHRLAELDAEQNRRTRELSQADAEVSRHVTTLGTLVNLHRFKHSELSPLYRRIDDLRNAIGIRSTESDRLTADSEAYDRESYRRGYLILGAVSLGIVLLILILIVAL